MARARGPRGLLGCRQFDECRVTGHIVGHRAVQRSDLHTWCFG